MPMTFRARLTPLPSANSSERFLNGICRPCPPRIGRSMKSASIRCAITSISQHHLREAPSIRQQCTETTPSVLAADALSTVDMCKLLRKHLSPAFFRASPTSCHGMGATMWALHMKAISLNSATVLSRNCQLALADCCVWKSMARRLTEVRVIFFAGRLSCGRPDSAIT